MICAPSAIFAQMHETVMNTDEWGTRNSTALGTFRCVVGDVAQW